MSDQITSGSLSNTDEYPAFLKSIKNQFHETVSENTPLFATSAVDLYDVFLENIPEQARQTYTCSACKQFTNTYGRLVCISDDGQLTSVFWDAQNVPAFFAKSVGAMQDIVLKSRITGLFLSGKEVWGIPVTGEWNHISVNPPKENVFASRLQTAGQMMAEKKEDFRILQSSLHEYPVEVVNQALSLLKSDSLYRSERCLGLAEWLQDLHTRLAHEKRSDNRINLLWRAAATAPAGFCHIKSTMIGTLLDDIVAGLPYETVSRKFADKMHPLQYQRPQAQPTEGNVKEAEKIIEKLGAQKSLERRFARLDELNLLWKPKETITQEKTGGIFSHLLTKKQESPKMDVPPIKMTWRKFSETVLPEAEKIEYWVKAEKANYSAIVTAVFDDAPPIYQWDRLEQRNPFSWYVYMGGSEPQRWHLSTGYCQVSGICLQPSMWYGDYPHQGCSVFFILHQARDKGAKGTGSALFPEMLISELRAVRSTIEAYSKSTDLKGGEEASACGIKLENSSEWHATFRVTTSIGLNVYTLDRWD